MKRYSGIFLLPLLLAMGTSCVSKKKYDELARVKERVCQDSTVLADRLTSCDSTLTDTRVQLTESAEELRSSKQIWDTEKDVLLTQINQQGIELDEKNEALRQRAERLQELQNSLESQTAATRALRKAVADALVSFSSDELQVSIEDGKVKVSLSENLLFPSAGVDLDPKGVEALGKLAVVLKNSPDVNIMIVGYTDSLAIRTQRFRNNWDLSVIRATTIASILQEKYGVPGERLTAAGQSEFAPVATNRTEEGRALNRRTEIFLTPKLDALIEMLNEDDQVAEP